MSPSEWQRQCEGPRTRQAAETALPPTRLAEHTPPGTTLARFHPAGGENRKTTPVAGGGRRGAKPQTARSVAWPRDGVFDTSPVPLPPARCHAATPSRCDRTWGYSALPTLPQFECPIRNTRNFQTTYPPR